jgi:cytoskeletal protein CcmA (bactofilin family)
MFTRSSSTEPKRLESVNPNPNPNPNPGTNPNHSANLNVPQRRPAGAEAGPKSVIGNDLKIIGQGLKIISQGTLQVDGEVEGDVGGSEVIIGEKGRVTGTVAAERVIVRGQISGVIRGVTVTLQASSKVEGDIHHLSLAIEQGAEFDGRCRRPADAGELNLNLEASQGSQPRPN